MNGLILFPRRYYECKMSIVRRDIVRALVGRGSVLSGQGWDSWNNHDTVEANRMRLAPDSEFVFWYKPEGGSKKDGVPPLKIGEIQVPTVMAFNECYWPNHRAQHEVIDSKTKVVICHHQNDLERFPSAWNTNVSWRFTTTQIPHCVSPEWFTAMPTRSSRLILTGVLSPEFYPIRCQVADAIKRGDIPDAVVMKHPGYRLKSVEQCDQQAYHYAEQLQRSTWSFCDGSKYDYSLAKYVESWAAGCCVVGPIPDDLEYTRTFGDLHVEANSASEVLRVMRDTSIDPHARGREGAKRAQQARNPQVYVERLYAALDAHSEWLGGWC